MEETFDVEKILFRASGNANLISAKGELTQTIKNHLASVFVQEKYGRQKKLDNKYITKGLAVEEDSLTLYSRFKKEMFLKNEEFFKNEYIKGTPDIIKKWDQNRKKIIDIKSSYNIHTFFEMKTKIKTVYDWQMQSYMALTGAEESTLAYCLTDMPGPLLNDELRRLEWKMGVSSSEDPLYIEAADAMVRELTFDDIPLEERIIEIHIPRDQQKIMYLYEQVIKGRRWIKENLT